VHEGLATKNGGLGLLEPSGQWVSFGFTENRATGGLRSSAVSPVARNEFWPTEYQPSSRQVPRVTGSGLRVFVVQRVFAGNPLEPPEITRRSNLRRPSTPIGFYRPYGFTRLGFSRSHLLISHSRLISLLSISLWVARAEGRRRRNEEERRKGEEE